MSLNFSSNSWQVRLVVNTWKHYPRSICPFFWMFLGAMLIVPWSWPLLAMVPRWGHDPEDGKPEGPACWIGFLTTVLWVFTTVAAYENFAEVYGHGWWLWTILLSSPVFMTIGLIIFGMAWVMMKIGDAFEAWWIARTQRKYPHGKPQKPKKEKKPSVIMAFVRAKKAKLCPLITYEPYVEKKK